MGGTRKLVLGAAAAALVAAPAWAEDTGPFSRTLTGPDLGAKAFEQDPALPDTCDLPPKDDTFKALGTHAGPSAVAHHGSGRVIQTSAPAPYPQLFPTGDFTIEPNIGVTSSGALFVDVLRCGVAPGAYQPTVLRSTDDGQTFHDVSPSLSGHPTHPLTEDPYLYVDKRTDRVFSADIDNVGGCQPLSWSDDGGKSWTDTQTGCSLADHENIFAGPPPPAGTKPSGYPDVFYYCAIDAGALLQISKATSCVVSTDGGMTSARSGQPAYTPDPSIVAQNPPQCDGGTGPGFVDSHGTVYLPRGWCGQPYLAISRDEGQTWDHVQVAKIGMGVQNDGATDGLPAYNHEAGVRADGHGDLFYVWVAHDRLPYLAVSRDGGTTWSAPVMFGAPGMRQAWNPTIDIAPGGRIAMGYVASSDAPRAPSSDGTEDASRYRNTTWNGYITFTDDPLSNDPTFYTASVNDPSRPLIRASSTLASDAAIPCGQARCGPELDFLDLKMTRDGTPWAIFVDACGTGTKDCISGGFGEAVVARMVTAGTTAALDAAGHALFGATSATTPAPPLATRPSCRSRRRIVIRVHRPRFVRIVSAKVFVGRRRVATRHGRRLTAVVDLRGLPRGRFTVTITARTATGRTITGRRRYRTCVPRRS